MQIKNIIISSLFLFKSVVSSPRRNGNHVEHVEVEGVEYVEVEGVEHVGNHLKKRFPRRNRNRVEHVEGVEGLEVEHVGNHL